MNHNANKDNYKKLNPTKAHSLRWISKQSHITRASLYARIKKLGSKRFRKFFMFKIKNKWFIQPTGIQLISGPKRNSTSKYYHSRKGIKNNEPTKDDYKAQNIRLVKLLQKVVKNNSKIANTNIKLNKTIFNLINQNTDLENKTKNHQKHNFWWHLWHKY